MKQLLKEPLLHFLTLGLALFLLYNMVGNDKSADDTIVFNDYDLNNILTKWETQWKRPPTEQELKSIIEQTIKQELFYQEALKMNLDHNDEIIKRRLAQKMEFLSNDLVQMKPASEEQLIIFYEQHKHNYLSSYNYTLQQVCFSYDYHRNPLEKATKTLNTVKDQASKRIIAKGDTMSFPNTFNSQSEKQIRKELGGSFTNALKDIPLNTWSGPIQSGFGYHLVYISKRIEPKPKSLEDIRPKVLKDFNYYRQQQLDSALYLEIKKQYTFDLDLSDQEFDPAIIELVNSTLSND